MGRVAIGLAASLALIAAGCSDDGDGGAQATTTVPGATSTTAPEPTTTGPTTTAVPTTTTEAPPEWEQVAGGADCMCADGSPWQFWVREADPARVVLYFQGGGACFSVETCAFDSNTYDVTVTDDDDPAGAGGIFDFTDPANPFADWSFVFVPYCTGDVHIGDNTQDYGEGLVVEHNGFVNGTRALDELTDRFPDASQVFVTGSSAGGVPAPLFAGLVTDRLPDAAVTALSDASGAYPDVPALNLGVGSLWGTFAAAPDWPENQELAPEDWSIPGLFVQAGLHAPDVVMARVDHAFDATQARFAELLGVAANDVVALIDQNEAQIEAAGVALATYVAPGADHTVLSRPELYTLQVEGVALIDWVTSLAERAPVDDVHCTDCAG